MTPPQTLYFKIINSDVLNKHLTFITASWGFALKTLVLLTFIYKSKILEFGIKRGLNGLQINLSSSNMYCLCTHFYPLSTNFLGTAPFLCFPSFC